MSSLLALFAHGVALRSAVGGTEGAAWGERMNGKKPPEPKPVHLCHVSATPVRTDRGMRVYTTATDKQGRLWEKWSDGPWSEIERPRV